MTWWTRHDDSPLELSDDENEDEEQDNQHGQKSNGVGEMTLEDNESAQENKPGKSNVICLYEEIYMSFSK